jgi:branched-chain amino acid transport system ATP-binding protein
LEAGAPNARLPRANVGRHWQVSISIILVEQNAMLALTVAQYGYVLETGSVVMQGNAQELLRDEGVKKAYLGI